MVKNLIKYPFTSKSKKISNEKYNQFAHKSKTSSTLMTESCRIKDESIISAPNIDSLENSIDEVRDKYVCSCESWGSCSKDECDCGTLCPEGFKILNRRDIKENSLPENSLAFRNEPVKQKYKIQSGYCWGHATVTQRFNRLAFFEPGKKPPYDINSSDSEEQNKAIKYFKKKIDKIVNNEVATFDGFSNLKELSDHPALQSYIADKVALQWAENAMSPQGIDAVMGEESVSRERIKNFVDSVVERLDNHQQPTIVFGAAQYTHAMLISHYEKDENGKILLCARDSNYPVSKGCERFMLADGPFLRYPFNNGLTQFRDPKIAHNENADVVEQVNALKNKCLKDKDCN